MLHDYPGKFMLTDASELKYLEKLVGCEDIFVDLEATSGDDKKKALNPWRNCDILGICVTADDYPNACYIPLRHRNSIYNVEIEPVYAWLRRLIKGAKRWINHHVKYDAQVAINCADIDISHLELCDTITLAKIIDSDRYGFKLEELAKDWLGKDIYRYKSEIQKYTHTPGGNWKIHDYAVIPADVMHNYGCEDSITVRDLWHYCIKRLPEDCEEVWEAEMKLTKVLIDIERTGMHIDFKRIAKDAIKNVQYMFRLRRMLRDEVEKEFGKLSTGTFEPHKNPHCAEVLVSKMGLPELEWSKKPPYKASFGKETLKAYLAFPGASKRIIRGIMWYRHYHKLHTSFTMPYLDNHINLIIHPSFNQTVRTGRLSCSQPNMMQLSPAAKRYIKPSEPDHVIVEFDLSQIEYRYIANYIENPRIIEEYQANPQADFHQMMADLCGIKRKPAKAINFGVSFGAGKKKTILMLKAAFDPNDTPKGFTFDQYCDMHGLEVYKDYHERMPELKNTSKGAERVAKRRGYVRNVYGRRRNLTYDKAYRSFNTVIQSSAADFMKRVTLRLHTLVKGTNVKLLCLIHDSWLFSIPKSEKEFWKRKIKDHIETTSAKMAIPIYSSCEVSDVNWRKCTEEPIEEENIIYPVFKRSEHSGDEKQKNKLARSREENAKGFSCNSNEHEEERSAKAV